MDGIANCPRCANRCNVYEIDGFPFLVSAKNKVVGLISIDSNNRIELILKPILKPVKSKK